MGIFEFFGIHWRIRGLKNLKDRKGFEGYTWEIILE